MLIYFRIYFIGTVRIIKLALNTENLKKENPQYEINHLSTLVFSIGDPACFFTDS